MFEDRPLARQKALVTGANSGRGVAIALGRAGADVVVNYVEGDDVADVVVNEIRQAGCKAIADKADVLVKDQVEEMFDRAVTEFGKVDILVANAGLQCDCAFADMTLEKWNKVLAVNLTGQFLCAQAAAREFLRCGVVPSVSCAAGKMICMSSVRQEIPWTHHANCRWKAWRRTSPTKGIRVNGNAPGAIKTPINTSAWNMPGALKRLLTLIPYGRIGLPEGIARSAVWLASDESDHVVGTTLFVEGSMTLYPGFSTNG